MEPDPDWRRQVKSKKSKPNLKNSPPVKKKRKVADIYRQTEDESQDSIASSAGKLPVSNEETGEEIMSDSENEGEDQATNETDFSAEGGAASQDNELPQQDTSRSRTDLSGQGFYSNLPDLPLELDTDKIDFDFSDEAVEIDPEDLPLQQNTADSGIPAERDNSDLQDMSLSQNTADDTDLPDNSDLQDVNPQYNLTGERSESYVPDLNNQPDGAEASDTIKKTSEGASPVKELTCLVCNDAEAEIAVLPCRHLCLCLDCELECVNCPICGGPKHHYFYKRS